MTAPAATACELRRRSDLQVLQFTQFDGLDADIVVTTRHGGVSVGAYDSLNLSLGVQDSERAVLENRRRVAAALGTDPASFVYAHQVHGSRVATVTAADRGRGTLALADAIPDTDALVTAAPGTVLAIPVGDCAPIALYDPAAHVLGCVHAGWRGTVARITDAALAAMAELGARPGRVLAGIGPVIGPDRYQVGPEVAEAVRACFPGGPDGPDGAGDMLRPDGTGRWLLDLWAANRRLLLEAGVPAGQIQVADVSTGSGGPFFSDRTARPCGRFALVAQLKPRRP